MLMRRRPVCITVLAEVDEFEGNKDRIANPVVEAERNSIMLLEAMAIVEELSTVATAISMVAIPVSKQADVLAGVHFSRRPFRLLKVQRHCRRRLPVLTVRTVCPNDNTNYSSYNRLHVHKLLWYNNPV